MTQYNSTNLQLSNEPFNKLKSGIKNGTEVTLNLSSNVIGDSNDETTSFPHKLLTRQLFAKNSSANIKLSKSQLSKMVHLRGFLVKLLEPLLKTGFYLMKNVFKPLAKSVLIPLELTAAALAAGVGIH